MPDTQNTTPPDSAGKKTVLVVEDDPFLSNLLKTRLERAGINVLRAGDGEEALRILSTSKPALVMLDIIIPKKSGFEVLESIRENPDQKDLPVIIVSNLGQEGDISRGKNLGAIAYFIKAQTSIDDIVSRVKGFLDTGAI